MLMVDLDSDAGGASPYACDRQNTHHELEALKCATRPISGASLVENSRTRAEKTMWELHLIIVVISFEMMLKMGSSCAGNGGNFLLLMRNTVVDVAEGEMTE